MASAWRFLLLGLGCLAGGQAAAQPSPARFTLKADLLEALEGGPLVVKVTLSHDGDRPVDIRQDLLSDHDAEFIPLPGWELRPRPFTLVGSRWGRIALSPGEGRVEIIRLHHEWANIEAGKASLHVEWPVHLSDPRRGGPGRLIADPSATVDLDVPAATPEGLSLFCKRTLERLRQPDVGYEERQAVVEDVLQARRHGMALLALSLIESATHDTALRLLDFLGECREVMPDLDARLAQLEANPDWAAGGCAFHYWSRHHADLSRGAWETLAGASSVWARSLAYATFPTRCGGEWKQCLISDLRDLSRPLPSSQFASLLADLDSDDFDVRERASARFVGIGERVEAQLLSAPEGHLSAEAGRRVVEILGKLRDAKQPPDCRRALGHLATHDAPECGELLEVLAEGQPDAWLTQQAKEKLAQWRKAQGLPEK